jgi:hypothetical protein
VGGGVGGGGCKFGVRGEEERGVCVCVLGRE